ncbi:toprim domain-containing protein [Pararhodobacter sp.]|uniref:DUF7146 domain-containing protein n=1 Tax=Pararhodobacter sp. TaxID=2127056 RepID=UPI002AFF81E6|nr:toprim domain-containing protein [Pararhodobacter sp.]
MNTGNSEARAVTAALAGKWMGTYGLCKCVAHHDTEPSLSVSQGRDGKLLLNCHAGCIFTSILNALRARGIVSGEGHEPTVDPAALHRAEMQAAKEMGEKARRARQIWNEAGPLWGSVGENYLRARGLGSPRSTVHLRCHGSLYHAPSGQHLPAMVAEISGVPDFAIHRTFLMPDGSGKIDVAPAKLMLGQTAGGVVVLDHPAEGTPLLIGEGIETTLAASELTGRKHTVWAALSAANMARVTLLGMPGVLGMSDTLVICADGDPAGRQAADTLATRADRLGWKVSILEAPDGQDALDMLLARRAANTLRGAAHV